VDAWTLKRLAANSPRPTHHTDTLWQHFAEIAKDHQNGIFAGTNDLVERITEKRPIELPEFLKAHREAFVAYICRTRGASNSGSLCLFCGKTLARGSSGSSADLTNEVKEVLFATQALGSLTAPVIVAAWKV
jgi:hypothetical protein